MRIVITDSGLGGLSVVGELELRLGENPIFERAELIFFNSLFSPDYGYNSMKSIAEKAGVFNNALNSMVENYNPDLILIACNTLSVVYPHTNFAKNPKTKVVGIVESGVSLFAENLQNSDDKLILLGTPTTINSNVYKNELIKLGISENQIINEPCFGLETAIQNDPNSDKTKNLIANFVSEALQKMDSIPNKVFAALCCTHYGYSENLFLEEISNKVTSKVGILNPNNTMIDFLFENSTEFFENMEISVKIVSQVKLKDNEINSLSSILELKSPKTGLALKEYSFIDNLFSKYYEPITWKRSFRFLPN